MNAKELARAAFELGALFAFIGGTMAVLFGVLTN